MKNKDLNPLDNLFRQGLDDAEVRPPSASWAQMEALLDAQPKQKRRAAAWWWAAAAAIIPLFLVGIWWLTKPQETGSQLAETKPKAKEQMVQPHSENASETKPFDITSKPEKADQLASLNHTNSNALQNSKNEHKPRKAFKSQSVEATPRIANAEPEPIENRVVPPMPHFDEPLQANPGIPANEDDSVVASIEFKVGKPDDKPEAEVASIEFKPNHAKRPTLSEQFNKFRNGEINLPTIGDAKQNLFALLSHK